MAKAKSSNLTTEVIPSSSVGNQKVSISLKVGSVDASDLLVVDPTALEDIKTDLNAEVSKQVSSAKSEILQEVATNDEAHKQEIQQLGTTLSSSIGTKVENAKNELSSQNSSSIASGLESAKQELKSTVQDAVDLKVTDQVTTAKEEIKQEAEQSINTKVQDAKRELESSTSQLVTQEVNASKTEIKQELSASTEQSIQTAKTELNRSIAENTNKIGDLSTTGLPAEKQGNVGLGLQYLKEKYEEVKSTHDQNAQEVNAKLEELSNKVEQNSNPIKYVGILSETKDNIEAKGSDKGTWLDSQIRVLNSKLKPADGMILETSDHYIYARKGGGWILHTDKPVDLATNDTAGIVQGKDVEGSGYIKVDGSGNMKLVDYQALKNDIALRKTENTNLSNKLDRKTGDFSSLSLSGSDNGKPVSVVEIANAILGIIGDLSNITGSQPSTIVEALNEIIASKEQINQTITGLMPKSGGTFTGKVAMDTGILSYGDNELIPLKELKRIVGDFSTVDVNTKSTVTEVLKSLRTLITDNTNSLNNKLNASGGVLTGKITSDGNQSGFVDNDYVPLKEIKRLLGDYESLSVSNHGSVTEVLQSLLNLINTNTSSIRGNSDKIGDLSTTGLDAQHQSTVAAGIKNLKDTLTALDGRESSHNSNITSRLDSMDERINANSTQVRYVGDLTVDKDTVEAKGGSKDSWLDSQVPVLKPGQTAMDGDFVNTTDGHAYYRKGTTWVLKLNNPIVPGTNATAGIIKGKDEAGHGYIKSTGLGDGTFELVDYQNLKQAIDGKGEKRILDEVKSSLETKTGDYTSLSLSGSSNGKPASVVEIANAILGLIGGLSSLSTSAKDNIVNAINELQQSLATLNGNMSDYMPKSGGEFTNNVTMSSSIVSFNPNDLIPKRHLTSVLGDFSSLNVSSKGTVTEALNSLLDLIKANTTKIGQNNNKIGDLSTTGLPQQNQTSVSEGLKYAKTEIDAVKQKQRQDKQDLTSRLDALTNKVNVNSTSMRYIGTLTEDKNTVEGKGSGKDAWLDSQVSILKPGETAQNGNFVLTSDGHAYHRYGDAWFLVEKDAPITLGTDSDAGLIKGKDETGHGYIKSTGLGDGTFELVDYQDILDAIRDKVGSSDFTSYKQEVNGKFGNLSNINLTGTHDTVENAFNSLITLIGSVSSITGVTNTSVVTAIKDLVTNLENVKNTADAAMPKSGGEFTGKPTVESSLSNFTDNELIPAKYVDDKLGDLNNVNVQNKTNLEEILNEIVGSIGGLSTLTTTEKSSIVGALNELVTSLTNKANSADVIPNETTTATNGIHVTSSSQKLFNFDYEYDGNGYRNWSGIQLRAKQGSGNFETMWSIGYRNENNLGTFMGCINNKLTFENETKISNVSCEDGDPDNAVTNKRWVNSKLNSYLKGTIIDVGGSRPSQTDPGTIYLFKY